MTVRNADRYLLRGGAVPAIYHGTVASGEQAVTDAREQSRFNPGLLITVWAYRGRERECIRAFVAGQEQATA